MFRDQYDVIVIGTGPAGLAAATVTAEAGLATLLVDENDGPGGQVYRATGATPVSNAVLGADYLRGHHLVSALRRTAAVVAHRTTVWSLDADLVVGLSHAGSAHMVEARRVIVATGALERPFPIPGWTLPGVMTVGAAQTLLKASGLVPKSRTVIAGMGPLLWLYAAQVLRAGGMIEAILDTTPRGNYLQAARHLPAFLLSPLLGKGFALVREVSARVPIIARVIDLKAEGSGQIEAVSYTTAAGRTGRIEVDNLLLHQGVVPNVNLAMAAGVAHRWDAAQLCFAPVLERDGGTSVPGIAIAGDGGGIRGAWVAEERGRLAGLSAVRALKPDAAAPDDQAIRQRLERHELGRAFLDALYRPAPRFRRPADGTIACRCEEVTAGAIRQAARMGCTGPNQLKAFLRAGMGPCQGRLCGLTVTELIAETRGSEPAAVGYYRLRPPVKPLALGEFAALPANRDAETAVVRL